MYSLLGAVLIFIRIVIIHPPYQYQDCIDPREFYFVDASCAGCDKTLRNSYRYYRLDCEHVFCEKCFILGCQPDKKCSICNLSLLYPEVFLYPDLFPDN